MGTGIRNGGRDSEAGKNKGQWGIHLSKDFCTKGTQINNFGCDDSGMVPWESGRETRTPTVSNDESGTIQVRIKVINKFDMNQTSKQANKMTKI
jgi:hypothetical protein